jgi:hypothetical protein
VKHTGQRPVVITDAQQSPDDQLRSRQIRYTAMMGLRVVCLIAAAILASVRVPLLGLWLTICLVGMVLLPWLAVLIANDRPAKEQHRLRHRPSSRRPADAGPAALGGATESKVIDADEAAGHQPG